MELEVIITLVNQQIQETVRQEMLKLLELIIAQEMEDQV